MEGAEKLLNAVKGWPLWMRAALAIVALAANFYSPLQAAVPAPYRAALPLISALLLAMMAFGGLEVIHRQCQAARAARTAEDKLRLELVYGPLSALFWRRHVTISTSVGAPRLKHRLVNAWEELLRYRRVSAGVRQAVRAFGDRQVSTSAEFEYGSDFPLAEIINLCAANPALAGPDLLKLVERAERSRYEDGPTSGLLTDKEYELYTFIDTRHERLARRTH